MAPVCPIRLPRWPRRAFIRSNTCAKGFWTVPMPCWLKRAQLLGATKAARRPTKVGPRDREAARGPDLGVGMGTGVIPNAYMVEELSDSTLDERHLDLRRPRNSRQRSFPQVMRMTSNGHGTQIRACVSEFGVLTPLPPSVTTHIDHARSQSASPSPRPVHGRRKWSF